MFFPPLPEVLVIVARVLAERFWSKTVLFNRLTNICSNRPNGNRGVGTVFFFSPHWYKTFPWLTVCTARGKVFCWYCTHMSLSASGTALLSKRQENVFTETGFDNWKKASEKFTTHSQSNLHREAMMKWQHRKQAGMIDTIMENACRSEQLYRRQMLIKQMESLQFLLKQGLAIRGHDEVDGNLYQLLLLRSNDCPQLKI